MITFALGSLSATIVFPILAPLFLNDTPNSIIHFVPTSIRAILLGIFLASFPLGQFIFSPLMGEYADRRGRKNTYLFSMLLEALGYALCAVAINKGFLSLLFLGRFITGVAAGNMSVCLAALVDLSQSEKAKVKYFSYGSALIGMMFVLGPFLGGKLSDPTLSNLFSLSFPMWIGAVLAIVNFFILLFFFSETLDKAKQIPFDVMGALHNVQLAFRTEAIKDLYIIYFFFLFSWNMIYQFIPAILVEEFQSKSSIIGDISALMGVIWILGTLFISRLMHTKVNLKFLLLFFLTIFTFLSFFIPVPKTMLFFLIYTGFSVFLAGGMWPIFTGAISNAADQNIQGKVLGLSQSIQSLSMMLAPLIGGFFLQAHNRFPFTLSSISALIAAALLTKKKSKHFQL